MPTIKEYARTLNKPVSEVIFRIKNDYGLNNEQAILFKCYDIAIYFLNNKK